MAVYNPPTFDQALKDRVYDYQRYRSNDVTLDELEKRFLKTMFDELVNEPIEPEFQNWHDHYLEYYGEAAYQRKLKANADVISSDIYDYMSDAQLERCAAYLKIDVAAAGMWKVKGAEAEMKKRLAEHKCEKALALLDEYLGKYDPKTPTGALPVGDYLRENTSPESYGHLWRVDEVLWGGYTITAFNEEPRYIDMDYTKEGYTRVVRHAAHTDTRYLKLYAEDGINFQEFMIWRMDWQNRDFTSSYTYDVYELIWNNPFSRRHSCQTSTTDDSGKTRWWGRVNSIALPKHIDDMKPYSDLRYKTVKGYQAWRDAVHDTLAQMAFPEDF